MEMAWPQEPHRYEISEWCEKKIMKEDIKNYHVKGWDKISKLYGCDKGKAKRCSVPRVYATIKGKTFNKENMSENGTIKKLKARPIAPHTKHVLKRVYNKVATATLFCMMQVNVIRSSRLWTTREYVERYKLETKQAKRNFGRNFKVMREM